eukprot:COSAG06_NODE_715_length_12863_cov_38.702569_3_plen_115_part_00
MIDSVHFKTEVQKMAAKYGVKHIVAYGTDCGVIGATLDACHLFGSQLPQYPGTCTNKGTDDEGNLYLNTYSISMDVNRHTGLIPNNSKHGTAHGAMRDCFDLMEVLLLLLDSFE